MTENERKAAILLLTFMRNNILYYETRQDEYINDVDGLINVLRRGE